MNESSKDENIFTIEPGVPFARSLARQLLAETKTTPEILPSYRIILPNRRAIRTLNEAFLKENGEQATLLPQMQSLGDVDEEELSLVSFNNEEIKKLLDIPPSISPLRRQLLLAQTIRKIPGYTRNAEQSIELASALSHLMDQIHTENLDLKNLPSLVPDELAEHWQITLKFMEILSEAWPQILAEEGLIDVADRRNRLIKVLALHWKTSPPTTPVIAAGSTGSIPATAELLAVISRLPKGRIVLPGLDQEMDDESWDKLDESHPQYGLKHLLENMQIDRKSVRPWPKQKIQNSYRKELARELMRPAATTDTWIKLPQKSDHIKSALTNLSFNQCNNEYEEAKVISILFRESLETLGKTAALITPDRQIAKQVAIFCKRWNINVDDSAGQPLSTTPVATFLRLTLQACRQNISPVSILALLKHPFSKFSSSEISELDLSLRGLKPAPGFKGLKEYLGNKNFEKALKIIDSIEPYFTKILEQTENQKFWNAKKLAEAHIELTEELSKEPIWKNEDGETASLFFSEFLDQASLLPDIDLSSYEEILTRLMKNITVRPSYGTHPRLHILGQIEARMADADLIILAGLNEGTWPPDPGFDPWMSRPMRKKFGLPGAQRQIGLAAHDFAQGFCCNDVVLSRSKRKDGVPTVPARWLQRLETVLLATGLDKNAIPQSQALLWAKNLDKPSETKIIERPSPTPPISARPQKLYVTQIETLMKDPYSIYARHILKLRKLEPLEKELDAADKGEILHKILANFIKSNPDNLPPNSISILKDLAEKEFQTHAGNSSSWNFWNVRFDKIAHWFVEHEQEWRKSAQYPKVELTGEIIIQTETTSFTLAAKADRIDRYHEGTAIIDYKSGGNFSAKKIRTGVLPQLPLEGLIVINGGFTEISKGPVKSLSYWKLTGGTQAGEIIEETENLVTVFNETEEGLKSLIGAFYQEKTPYYSLPQSNNIPRHNDYEHLARVREWTALGEDTNEIEAA